MDIICLKCFNHIFIKNYFWPVINQNLAFYILDSSNTDCAVGSLTFSFDLKEFQNIFKIKIVHFFHFTVISVLNIRM